MGEKEFKQLIGDTKGIVLASVQKHLAGRFSHALDDVVQETYIRAYNSLVKNRIRDLTKLNSWLYVTAKNEAYRMNEKLSREEAKTEKLKIGTTAQNYSPTEEHVLSQMENQFVFRQIAKLPDRYREVIHLYAKGLAVKEISDTLGIRPGTVKSRTSRGLNILRNLVKENT